jgi:hypothetical protein
LAGKQIWKAFELVLIDESLLANRTDPFHLVFLTSVIANLGHRSKPCQKSESKLRFRVLPQGHGFGEAPPIRQGGRSEIARFPWRFILCPRDMPDPIKQLQRHAKRDRVLCLPCNGYVETY